MGVGEYQPYPNKPFADTRARGARRCHPRSTPLDVADAHVRALPYLFERGARMAFSLGTGQGYSVHHVIKAVRAGLGPTGQKRESRHRAGDPPKLVADPSRPAGIAAEISDLDTIVRTALNWDQRWS